MKRLAIICLLLPLPLWAQSQDEGRLVRFIEDALSDGVARSVDLQGFRGALSSEAALDRLTVADAEGIWLEIEGAVLNWNRAAVLRGEIEIRTLTADRLVLHRLPEAEPSPPSPEATGFALPELPVSIDIQTAAIARLELGAPVLGDPVVATAAASVTLAGGEGSAMLELDRIDGQEGRIALSASYDNTSTQTRIDLTAQEGAGGIAVSMLNIEDAPSVGLQINGEGPLEAFDARFALATDGVDRLSGTAGIQSDETGDLRVDFALGGDLRPVVSGDLETFLGDAAEIAASARIGVDGTIDLQSVEARSAALDLSGDLTIDPDGQPLRFDLAGRLAPPAGAETLALPGGGAEIASAMVDLSYNRRDGDRVVGVAELLALRAAGFSAPETRLTLDGALTPGRFDGRVALESDGLAHEDPGIVQALGARVALAGDVQWQADGTFALQRLTLDSAHSRASGSLSVTTGENALSVDAALTVDSDDLSAFGPLLSQPIGGAASGTVELQFEALTGRFETVLAAETEALSLPDLVPDGLLAGTTTVEGSLRRDETGITLDALELSGTALRVSATGLLRSAEADLMFSADLDDAALLEPRLTGPVSAGGRIIQDGDAPFRLSEFELSSSMGTLTGTATLAPGETAFPVTANLEGTVPLAPWSALAGQALSGDVALSLSGEGDIRAETAAIDLSAVAQDLSAEPLPAGLFAGETELSGRVAVAEDALTVTLLELTGSALTASLSGRLGAGTQEAALTATLRDGRILSSALPGAISLEASLSQTGDAPYVIDAQAQGPAGLQARITGTATPAPELDVRIQGSLPMTLADPFIAPQTLSGRAQFDLALRGPPQLSAATGTVTIDGARLGLPVQGIALEEISIRADISGGTARLDLSGSLRPAGALALSGQITLADPSLPATFDIRLDQGRIVDPALYDIAIDQLRLALSGALAQSLRLSGAVGLGVVELRVPDTGIGGAGSVPDIRHIGETAAERRTRLYAGLLDNAGGQGGSPNVALDLGINAPGRIFLRGRGLDAELGGRVRISGTTAAPVASGQFELLRGRLSILGQRLDLTDGRVTLQGGEPFLSLTAETDAGEFRIFITVEGNASAPEVRFRSTPELPEDEVLAQLIFGRSIGSLSAVQALQLADGIAGLAGGGSGVLTRLREQFGLDNLDIRTDEAGNAAVTAGRYISDNVYTDVTVEDGGTGVSINIDLTPSLTARGGVDSDGTSSLGVFFERDY